MNTKVKYTPELAVFKQALGRNKQYNHLLQNVYHALNSLSRSIEGDREILEENIAKIEAEQKAKVETEAKASVVPMHQHKVMSNETYASLAMRYYGNEDRGYKIALANANTNNNIGHNIFIPDFRPCYYHFKQDIEIICLSGTGGKRITRFKHNEYGYVTSWRDSENLGTVPFRSIKPLIESGHLVVSYEANSPSDCCAKI